MTDAWLLLVPLRITFLAEVPTGSFLLASRNLSLEYIRLLIIAKAAGKMFTRNNS